MFASIVLHLAVYHTYVALRPQPHPMRAHNRDEPSSVSSIAAEASPLKTEQLRILRLLNFMLKSKFEQNFGLTNLVLEI